MKSPQSLSYGASRRAEQNEREEIALLMGRMAVSRLPYVKISLIIVHEMFM